MKAKKVENDASKKEKTHSGKQPPSRRRTGIFVFSRKTEE
jgi:hypothetical protein